MDSKAADSLVDVIRDIVRRELDKKDSTILCQVTEQKDNTHFDVCVVPDSDITVHNVLNNTNFTLSPGDYVYLYKINNQLNNSFIISKVVPYVNNASIDDKK